MAASKRNQIKADLEQKMRQKNLTSALYISHLEQYMSWYDQLVDLNRMAKSATNDKLKFDCMNEIRQIQKSMTNLLKWMGIDPNEEAAAVEEDYDL